MSTSQAVRDSAVRRVAYTVLAVAVRGRRAEGGEWGEAILAEFGATTGDLEAVRWTLGGLRAVWIERRAVHRSRPLRVRIARRAVQVALIGVVAGLLVNRFVLTVGYQDSGSMEPSFLVTDRFVLDRAAFRITGLHRGDVVQFVEPGTDRLAIKRVIGLPGDTIACQDGHITLDGSTLAEPYLSPDPDYTQPLGDCPTTTVPAGRLYVLGDHRIVSLDSRKFGTISSDIIRGRVLFLLDPPF